MSETTTPINKEIVYIPTMKILENAKKIAKEAGELIVKKQGKNLKTFLQRAFFPSEI